MGALERFKAKAAQLGYLLEKRPPWRECGTTMCHVLHPFTDFGPLDEDYWESLVDPCQTPAALKEVRETIDSIRENENLQIAAKLKMHRAHHWHSTYHILEAKWVRQVAQIDEKRRPRTRRREQKLGHQEEQSKHRGSTGGDSPGP